MPTITETFEACEIILENDTKLTINGKQINFEHNPDSGKWFSRYLPYTEYDSLLDMARAIIHDTVEFTHLNP
jgi:hypothetical protein